MVQWCMANGWHRHYNLRCIECEVVVYPRVTCIMWRGPSGCTLPQTIHCEDCIASESFRSTGSGYSSPEVGIYTAEEHASGGAQQLAQGDVRDLLQDDVLDEPQSVVQDQEYQDGTAYSLGPKPTPVEQVRPYVPEEARVSSKD